MSDAGFDAARFRDIERRGYNLIAGRYGAAAQARATLNAALVAAAELAPGQCVLDLASGPGTLAGLALAQLGAAGRVVATDLAEAALRVARDTLAAPALACAAADAERLCFADASVDRVLCGLGLMFFPDGAAALAEAHRVLRPGGLLALSVWGAETDTPLVACALATLRRTLPAPKVARPSIFRYGDATLLAGALAAAGFEAVRVASVAFDSDFADAAAYWQAFLDLAGGAAWSLAQLPAARRERLAGEVATELAPYRRGSGYRMTSRVLIATARRAPGPRL